VISNRFAYLGDETRYLSDTITAMPFEEGLRALTQWIK